MGNIFKEVDNYFTKHENDIEIIVDGLDSLGVIDANEVRENAGNLSQSINDNLDSTAHDFGIEYVKLKLNQHQNALIGVGVTVGLMYLMWRYTK